MVYPTALLLTAILIVVGLGIYQRLSADVEEKVDEQDKAHRSQSTLTAPHGLSGRKSWSGKLDALGTLITTIPTLAAW